MSYRVELPVFSGPLDLLLHLIRQQEVDIHEVSIAKILDGYLEHLDILHTLNLADIGEFVVMASTLMEIKSRELLPREEVALEEELDPRDELIKRLLEYKRYRDLSARFERLWYRRRRMLGAGVAMPAELRSSEDEDGGLDIGDAEIWSITAAFAKLLKETGNQPRTLHFDVERRNMRYYLERVLGRLKGRGRVPFERLFDPTDGRYGAIGVFVTILELMKQGFMRARQDDCFGPLEVEFTGELDLTAEEVMSRGIDLDDEPEEEDGDELAASESNGAGSRPEPELAPPPTEGPEVYDAPAAPAEGPAEGPVEGSAEGSEPA